jgi:hypothetical protein
MCNCCSRFLNIAFAMMGLLVSQPMALQGQVGRVAGTIDLSGLVDPSDLFSDDGPQIAPPRRFGGQPRATLGEGSTRSLTIGDADDDASQTSGQGASKSKSTQRKRNRSASGGMSGMRGAGGGGGGGNRQKKTKNPRATAQTRPQTHKSAIKAYLAKAESVDTEASADKTRAAHTPRTTDKPLEVGMGAAAGRQNPFPS